MPMGGVELLAVLAILLLLFGAKRVPQLAKSLGVGARELKKAASEEQGADADRSETKAASEEEGDDADRSETRAASEGADGSRTKKISEDSPYERDRA
jgi:sec-independent protein translocase protein TatA